MPFTEDLRRQFSENVGTCPCCGQNTKSLRLVAEEIGIGHVSLWRFLSGRSPSSETIDAIVTWLDKSKRHT